MSRKLIVLFASLTLVALFFVIRAPSVEAQSAGCSAFPGSASGFLQEFGTKDTGVRSYNAGETIQIVATEDGTTTPFPNIEMTILGTPIGQVILTGSALSYTFPATSDYWVVIRSTFGVDANIAASCSGGAGGAGPQWTGFSDGRLSPDPAEYYSVFCQGIGFVDVYRAFQGQGILLARINQRDLAVLALAGPTSIRLFQTTSGDLNVQRIGYTQFRFYGNSGNRAPEFGEKTVDLAPCGLVGLNPTPVPLVVQPVEVVVRTPTPRPDRDGDGVWDGEDLCPALDVSRVRADSKSQGCRDSDGDGFVNRTDLAGNVVLIPQGAQYADDCPTVFGDGYQPGQQGCPTDPASIVTVDADLEVVTNPVVESVSRPFLWQAVTLGPVDVSSCAASDDGYYGVEVVEAVTFRAPSGNGVNARESPSTTARVVGTVNPGLTVDILKRTGGLSETDWVYVSISPTTKGWVQTAAGFVDGSLEGCVPTL